MLHIYMTKNNNTFNKKKMETEFICSRVCINPKYPGVRIYNPDAKIMIDSGAFQDRKNDDRISFEDALGRQLNLESKIGIISDRIVSYDYIENADETILANKFLSAKREELKPRKIVLMVQGSDEDEYLRCLGETLELAQPGDCIGFGGVARSSTNKKVRGKLLSVLPYAAKNAIEKGIKEIHFFGIAKISVIKEIKNIIDGIKSEYGETAELDISFDSSTMEVMAIFGNVLCSEKEKFIKTYTKEQKFIDYHPCDLTHSNMKTMMEIIKKYE